MLVACKVPPVVVERGGGPVDLPEHRIGSERICELDSIEAVGRHVVVVEAKQRRVGGAWLGLGRIAIHRLLLEHAHPRRALDRPGRRGLDLSGQIDIADAVGRRLRRGVGRAPIVLEQFHRCRRRRAEFVIGDPMLM